MQTLVNKTPRELARDYYLGHLSFEEYRSKRRRVIDHVTGSEEEAVEPTLPEAPAQPEPAPALDPPISKEVAPPADERRSSKTLPSIAAIVLLLFAAMGGWLLFSGDKEAQEPVAEDSDLPASPSRAYAPAPDEVLILVETFVTADDWQTEALADFVLAWGALEEDDQRRARGEPWFRALVDGLRERILEQRALDDIGGDADREVVLLSFAEHLGLTQLVNDLSEPIVDSTPVQQAVTLTTKVRKPEVIQSESADAETVDEGVAEDRTETPVKAPAPVRAVDPDVSQVPSESLPEQQAQLESSPQPLVRAAASDGDHCIAKLADTRRPFCRDRLPDGANTPILVVLPAGSFEMGSVREANEQPVHTVHIAQPFAISAYEISFADYQRYCRASGEVCPDSPWRSETDPITHVNWMDAQGYVRWLSSVTGEVYRLPSEAEWEYAARGGTQGDYPFKDADKILPSDARFNASGPLPVNDRSVNLNRYKLRHIVGNVREWVADAWADDYRNAPNDGSAREQAQARHYVVRGGSFADDEGALRSSARNRLMGQTRDKFTGFRVVRELHD